MTRTGEDELRSRRTLDEFKEWAGKYLPPEDELRDAILTEPDLVVLNETGLKMDAYSRMLDAKVRRMTRKTP